MDDSTAQSGQSIPPSSSRQLPGHEEAEVTLATLLLARRGDQHPGLLERQGARIMLEEINHDSKSKSHRTWISGILEKPFGRGVNLQIMTTMINELYAHVQHANADIFLPIEEKWYRVNDVEVGHRQFIVLDPDGYMLRFVEDLGVRKSK